MKKNKNRHKLIAAALLLVVSGTLGFFFRDDLSLRTKASTYGSAVLTWEANDETDLDGYRVYYDTSSHSGDCPSGYGSNYVDVGNVTSYTIGTNPGDPDLIYGQTYYFSITAYDDASPANESECSGEESKLISAPTITNVTSTNANAYFNAGDSIRIKVNFSEAVTSMGNVTVTLETGTVDRTCTFSITNATSGSCVYVVRSGDRSSDLNVKSIAGIIKDQGMNEMVNFTPATNLMQNKNIRVDTTIPTGIIRINNNATSTTSRYVTLYLNGSDTLGVTTMRMSNDKKNWSAWISYSTRYYNWDLRNISYGGSAIKGTRRVYIQFKDAAGNRSSYYQDAIIYK